MNGATASSDAVVGDDELIAGLEHALHETLARRVIRQLVRQPSRYQSSYPLEELTAILDDGDELRLIFKNVSPRALSPAVRRAKPSFLDNARREINVYRTILCSAKSGAPRYYGSLVDEAEGRYWLFLENVAGQELYQIGDFELWCAAARWLARFHSRFASLNDLPRETTRTLISFDEPYYRQWFERAVQFTRESDPYSSRVVVLECLAKLAPRIIGKLIVLPTTLIHGEFYASNIIVNDSRQPIRVCPLDWERAAIGPTLIDLAALVAGNWPEKTKLQMAAAYREELLRSGSDAPSMKELLRGLNVCRLHLAIQWLGWSSDWTPPKDHRYDWLAEATQVAQQLGYLI